jgi:hypothetical protein
MTFFVFPMSEQTLKTALETADNIEYSLYLTGVNAEVVRQISADQNEPAWMLEHRLKCLEIFQQKAMPTR